ncbi:hypothetical protein Pmar_PMAR023813 [Perkinsus marinus ATCC 50983]|uniref:Uncharacterized protein n=1 Tax=Perkinsus marinus (strain ATCC 50983 / TXsc) TaxID=423536 RepID=C5KYK4_PERM5|nr:hypothetical protein Pmar_PMAR023813 [Perkinsus marinus ATCC 50983]EER10439.1 hypothetical protein Pmar_PMAR023813 [Perkinsus marinus ATCC 50983]|eukprot:XP_002778644.1 hypothetical protein Pmar_PMAR023813 [Perkinsus marinus ATCC 50983]
MFARYLALIAVTVATVAANKLCGDPLCWKEVGHASYCKDYAQHPAGRVCQTLDPKDARRIPCECAKPTKPPHGDCTPGDEFCRLATRGGVCERSPGSKFVGKCVGGAKPFAWPCICL